MAADFRVQNEGSLVLVWPQTELAEEWWGGTVEDGPTWGGAYVVEARYAQPLLDGMDEAGLSWVEA